MPSLRNTMQGTTSGDSQGNFPIATVYNNPARLHISEMISRIISPTESDKPHVIKITLSDDENFVGLSPGAEVDAIKFATTPIAMAALIFIRSCPPLLRFASWDVLSGIYMTLARFESEFNAGAAAQSTSARGAIQLTKDAYQEGLAKGLWLKASLTGKTQAFLDKMFAILPAPSGTGWESAAQNNPANDRDQYIASVGWIYLLLDTILRNWSYSHVMRKWSYRGSETARISGLFARYPDKLKYYNPGLMLLVSVHHIEGRSWLYNKGDWAPHHGDRFKRDTEYFAQLVLNDNVRRTLEGVQRIMDNFNKGTGDPYQDVREVGFPFIIPLLSLLKKKLPTITGKWGDKRKLNPKQGIKHKVHKGLDLRAAKGTLITAVGDGTITAVTPTALSGGFGNTIVLKTSDGDSYRYAHLSRIDVVKDQRVKLGDVLGATGNSGVVQYHLHFEYYPKGGPSSDPLKDPNHRWILSLKL